MLTAITQRMRPPQVLMKCFRYNKDGSVKREYNVTDRHIIKYGLIAMMAFLFLPEAADKFDDWVKQQHRDAMRPRMEELANQGKDEAALWMAMNFFRSDAHRIPELAQRGVPEAMYMQGYMLMRKGDDATGMDWVKRAADAGNANAIRFLAASQRHS
jgi:TPR repeat protein